MKSLTMHHLFYFPKTNIFYANVNRMATPPKRMQVFAPLKGSFPIDHFKECDEYYKSYMECIKSNNGASTKCRSQTKEYME